VKYVIVLEMLTLLILFMKVSEFYMQLSYLLTSHHTTSTHLLPYYIPTNCFVSSVTSRTRVFLIVNFQWKLFCCN